MQDLNRRKLLLDSSMLALSAAVGRAIDHRRLAAAEPEGVGPAEDVPVQEVRLKGVKLVLHAPRVVASTAHGHCWYADLLKFSTGELMLNHSLNADANTNNHNSQAVYLSTDGGRTFPMAYDVNGFHNGGGEPRIALGDGTIVGASTFLRPDPPDQSRRFVAHRWTYSKGGRHYCVEPWGAAVEGLPRDVAPHPERSRTWWHHINWFSDILALDDGRWLSTLSLQFTGDRLHGSVALESKDQGRTWRYLSTIASADAVPDALEGFDEPCLVQLENAEVMCVSRVGAGATQKLARAYSGDGGRTWSPLDRLSAYSVAPQLCRTKNGVLTLSTGRPGLFLWLSSDPRGKEWQSFDVLKHHNATVEQPWQMNVNQTTAYTALTEMPDNQIFLVYDRTPFGWKGVPPGSPEQSRIYLLEARIERT